MSKKYRFLFLVLTTVLFSNTTFSQVLDPSDDGIIPKASKHYRSNRVVPYPHLRQDDMLWSERHWERIDLREKINLSLYYPEKPLPGRKSLWDVLVDGIIDENTITEVFEDDMFEDPITATELESRLTFYDTLTDPDDPTIVLAINKIETQSVHVIAYMLKSDWYFDKQRGELKNRIIGIAPVVRDPQEPLKRI